MPLMKDDRWVLLHTAKYVTYFQTKGSQSLIDCEKMEDEMEDIEKKFIERFGFTRGNCLVELLQKVCRHI